ncbi:MAG TPA: prolipoprotein diacylglyceryl transferase family protein [Steroidobacteraceae bacterium]|nr:prolipoprotein diacylglyceryl transferase family protein [Steroidobacteraceae bacterium]
MIILESLTEPAATQAHWVLETLAMLVAGLLYWRARNAATQPPQRLARWTLLAGAAVGAALGSRALFMLQYAPVLLGQPLPAWLSGKTIVGGLLGGIAGVEVAKQQLRWRASTGDGFVWPLIVAIEIGRLGCQLSGLRDLTYGNPTTLPWAWNYGDGVPRHPVSLYEMLGVGLLALLIRLPSRGAAPGDRFRAFASGYLLLRVLLDFLKPPYAPAADGLLVPQRLLDLTPIQWACCAGLLYYAPFLMRRLRRGERTFG